MSSCRKLEIQNYLTKSPKSSEFVNVFNKQWSKTYVDFIKIGERKLSLRWDSNPQPLGFETKEHLRNTMRKENCENVFNADRINDV